MKKTTEHHDIFGRNLQIGDFVAAPYYKRNLAIYAITKLTPKMVKLKRVGSRIESNHYPSDTIKVDGPDVTMYCLKYNKEVR
jgi:hypothetical protein